MLLNAATGWDPFGSKPVGRGTRIPTARSNKSVLSGLSALKRSTLLPLSLQWQAIASFNFSEVSIVLENSWSTVLSRAAHLAGVLMSLRLAFAAVVGIPP